MSDRMYSSNKSFFIVVISYGFNTESTNNLLKIKQFLGYLVRLGTD
jgi:hypothetical protein